MTIHCWLRIDSFPNPAVDCGTIVMRSDNRSGKDPYFLKTLPNGVVEFGVTNLEGSTTIGAEAPTGVFFHVAATLDDSK